MFFKNKKNITSVEKLEHWYKVYHKLMYAVAYEILNDRAAAEDAVSESFVKMVNKTDRLDMENEPTVRNFFVIVCRNVAIDMYNRRRKENERLYTDDELMSEISDTYNPEKIVISREALENIIDSLQNLDAKYKDVLLLARIYKMSVGEISDILGVSVETVKKRLQRAKKKLIEDLAKKESSGQKKLL